MRSTPAFLFLLGACSGSDAPPPSEVRAQIAEDLVAVVDAAEASTAEGQSLPDTTQFSLLEGAIGGSFDGLLPISTSETISSLRARFAPEDPVEEDPYDGEKAAQWLNDNIFTDANEVSKGIYKVPASLACTEVQDDGTEAVDQECAESFDKLELRIRVSKDSGVLYFNLQLGPNHDEPLEVGLSKKLLSLSVDLDETEDAARALQGKLGGDLPNFDLAGRVTAKLEIPGAAAAKFGLSFDRDIAIRFADPGVDLNSVDAFRFASAKATVFSMALDGNAKSMEAGLGLGRTTAHVPDDIDDPVDVDLGGLTGTAKFAAGQPLKLENVSLGQTQTSVKIGGATGMTMDLNPNDGRSLSMTMAGNQLDVSPRLDFRSFVDHAVLGDDAPIYDVTRILIDGGLRARADESVEVLGAFSIETNPASYGFAATAGQCVSGTELYDSTRGEYYTTFAVGACQ